MSGVFDPYHRWLGIPPKAQPPNHYRLLGIDLFESDPEVIRDAAEQRMAHVRTYQLGEYSEISQRILNELAAAKARLLDPGKKAAYDASLEVQTKPPKEAPTAPVAAAVPPLPSRAVEPPGISRPSESVAFFGRANQLRPPNRSKEYRRTLALTIGGAVGGLLVVSLAAFLVGHWKLRATTAEPTLSQAAQRDQADHENGRLRPPDVPAARAPKLASIPNQTVCEGTRIQFRVIVADLGTAGTRLRFALAAGAPAGAAINPRTGIFTWVPTEAQAPGKYPITVQVLADGLGNLGDQTTFHVLVQRRAQPPVIYPVAQQTVSAGGRSHFTIGARNPVGMSDAITFSVLQAPPWVCIDPATGAVTCTPPASEAPGQYPVTVSAANGAAAGLTDEKTFTVVVTNSPDLVPQRKLLHDFPSPRMRDFEITLPSGKVLKYADLEMLDTARRETEELIKKCRAYDPNAVAVYQEGPQSTIAALANLRANTPCGSAVFFHSCGQHDVPKPKQYVTYQNGRWEGVLATWDPKGRREFWGEYLGGQRQGLCCLFKENMLIAILECTRNQVDAVHLIMADQVERTFTDVGLASADKMAGPILKDINEIEQRLRAEDRLFRDGVKKAVRMRLGDISRQKREEFRERAKGRTDKVNEHIRDMRRSVGL